MRLFKYTIYLWTTGLNGPLAYFLVLNVFAVMNYIFLRVLLYIAYVEETNYELYSCIVFTAERTRWS